MNMRIYNRYRDLFLRANLQKFDQYKRYLNNEGKYLTDLLLEIQAYDVGFRMQVWYDYKHKNWEIKRGKGIKDYVEETRDEYDENEVKEKKVNVNSYFQSSFENKMSEKIKNLMLERELMYISPKVDPRQKETGQPLMDDFTKNWPPFYKEKRLQKATEIKRRYELSDTSCLANKIFDQIIYLSNKGSTAKYVKDTVALFENGIEVFLPMFLSDLSDPYKVHELTNLRKSSNARYNTLCWRCGKPLIKKNNQHFCTRFENRDCYINRYKEIRTLEIPLVISRTKNKCDRCRNKSPLNYIHKLNGQEMQFCSNRCWETYRKAVYRLS